MLRSFCTSGKARQGGSAPGADSSSDDAFFGPPVPGQIHLTILSLSATSRFRNTTVRASSSNAADRKNYSLYKSFSFFLTAADPGPVQGVGRVTGFRTCVKAAFWNQAQTHTLDLNINCLLAGLRNPSPPHSNKTQRLRRCSLGELVPFTHLPPSLFYLPHANHALKHERDTKRRREGDLVPEKPGCKWCWDRPGWLSAGELAGLQPG
ncbi:hypothetical protein WMY93_028873 [Mugilogobius chulae]|uniref:Uncharacterized protein n=1 Tax=Mugilogobius chulae TaxID=88201 RepID=A0AAW0N0L7_9GOBI